LPAGKLIRGAKYTPRTRSRDGAHERLRDGEDLQKVLVTAGEQDMQKDGRIVAVIADGERHVFKAF